MLKKLFTSLEKNNIMSFTHTTNRNKLQMHADFKHRVVEEN